MKLEPLTKEQCEQVRQWRNAELAGLRTSYMLTEEMQEDFYKNVVCNQNSPHRYWAIIANETDFIGMGGLTNIQWENRIAEISLIIKPRERGLGLGEEAVKQLLIRAFNCLNIHTVIGECYVNNPAYSFWQKVARFYLAYTTFLPNRKYWAGKYWRTFYFSIDRENLEKEEK